MSAARASAEAGDRARALAEVDAALAVDPQFLAAHSLRDQILAGGPLGPPRTARSHPVLPPASDGRSHVPAASDPRRNIEHPLVSAEGYARFEERAKRRRVDRRIEAARSAIEGRRLREAAAALDEVAELDPNLPELPSLTAAFDQLRRSKSRPHRGPWLAAAAAFVAMILGASWIQESGVLHSRPTTTVAPLVQTETPAPLLPVASPAAPSEAPEATGTTGRDRAETDAPAMKPTAVPDSAVTTFRPAEAPPAQLAKPPAQLAKPSLPAPAVPPPAPLQQTGVPTPIASPPPPPARTVADAEVLTNLAMPSRTAASNATTPATFSMPVNQDELQVKQALQRYRVAYEGLDAQSAQAVWPAVNQVALARAFDGLESQRLTFDACTVQLSGEHATAVCRGTARYVPKIGSREPRVEPRVWSFALRKHGAEWKIDNARAER